MKFLWNIHMMLGSNPSRFGVKRSNTLFMRIIIVQDAQCKDHSYGFDIGKIRFPCIWWNLFLKLFFLRVHGMFSNNFGFK